MCSAVALRMDHRLSCREVWKLHQSTQSWCNDIMRYLLYKLINTFAIRRACDGLLKVNWSEAKEKLRPAILGTGTFTHTQIRGPISSRNQSANSNYIEESWQYFNFIDIGWRGSRWICWVIDLFIHQVRHTMEHLERGSVSTLHLIMWLIFVWS